MAWDYSCVTTIGLIGWLINNYEVASLLKIVTSIFAILALNVSVIVIDKKVKEKIKKLRDL